MFTGLVQDLGRIERLERDERGARLTIESSLTAELREGDSVAINGVCLTAAAVSEGRFSADAVRETLERSTLGAIEAGAQVNLELPLRVSDRLGGHLVQGHVDGVGEVLEVAPEGISRRVRIAAPAAVLRYVVEKGSIAVDGVSLTVVEVDGEAFAVSLIPETLERTTLIDLPRGRKLNLEVDVLAKYVEKLFAERRPPADDPVEASSR